MSGRISKIPAFAYSFGMRAECRRKYECWGRGWERNMREKGILRFDNENTK